MPSLCLFRSGKFSVDGVEYQLPINNGPNHLHGGLKGFSRRLWKTTEVGADFVTFEHLSEDGEEGYPSAVRASVKYRFPADANRLEIGERCGIDNALAQRSL